MTTPSANKTIVDGKFQHQLQNREKVLYWLEEMELFMPQAAL
jgi:hypothetical protein